MRLVRLSMLVFALVALFSANSTNAQGIVDFGNLSYDFGSVMEGEKPTYTFQFANTGDTPVSITHVQPSCGCTAPSYSTEPVAPGETGEVVVEYNSQGRPGDFNKTITVALDGADEANVILRITGTVVPTQIHNGVAQGNVMFDADNHAFQDVAVGDAVEHMFRMQHNGEQPLIISEARTFADDVLVTYPERPVFPGEIINVLVRVGNVGNVLNARGRMDVAVILHTNDELQPVKSLRLTGRLSEENATVASQ